VVMARAEVEAMVAAAVEDELRKGGATRLLRAEEAAEALAVSRRTLVRLVAQGLPFVELPTEGGRPLRRFRRRDLEAWVARHRRRSR